MPGPLHRRDLFTGNGSHSLVGKDRSCVLDIRSNLHLQYSDHGQYLEDNPLQNCICSAKKKKASYHKNQRMLPETSKQPNSKFSPNDLPRPIDSTRPPSQSPLANQASSPHRPSHHLSSQNSTPTRELLLLPNPHPPILLHMRHPRIPRHAVPLRPPRLRRPVHRRPSAGLTTVVERS